MMNVLVTYYNILLQIQYSSKLKNENLMLIALNFWWIDKKLSFQF